MTDSTKKSNNLFDFATSELSQDAFFCWSLNWLAVKEDTEDPYYKYGKAMLDLFLGEHKKDIYKEVKVKKQFNKIDVLVLFKDNNNNQYALIIEDKTNTSEHNKQIEKYKNQLNDALSKNQDFKNLAEDKIYTVYVKTGIMYSQDIFMKNTVNTVVDFDKLYSLLEEYLQESKGMIRSDIFLDYYHYLEEIQENHKEIEDKIEKNLYLGALKTEYGRYCFLKKIFYEENGKMDLNYKDKTNEADMNVETIKSGNNKGKVPFAEYTIWHAKQNEKMTETDQDEYHSIFWRIDSSQNKAEKKENEPFISLRYYDDYTKVNENTRKRKKVNYSLLRKEIEYTNSSSFKPIGERCNYKGSDLIYIPVSSLENIDFSEIKKMIRDITENVKAYCKENQSNFG